MNNKLVLATLALVSFAAATPAFAVKVKDCPKEITLSYASLDASNDAALNREIELRYGDGEEDEIRAIRDQVKTAPESRYSNLRLVLDNTANSTCSYVKPGDEAVGDNETRLETRDGRVILRVALDLGKDIVWTYHNVVKYSVDGLELEQRRGTRILGLFDHGSPRFTVGYAGTVSVE